MCLKKYQNGHFVILSCFSLFYIGLVVSDCFLLPNTWLSVLLLVTCHAATCNKILNYSSVNHILQTQCLHFLLIYNLNKKLFFSSLSSFENKVAFYVFISFFCPYFKKKNFQLKTSKQNSYFCSKRNRLGSGRKKCDIIIKKNIFHWFITHF